MAGNQAYARLNIVAGTNGTGKSSLIDRIIKQSHFRNALVYVESIDLGGQPFDSFPLIDLYGYKGGKVRIDADTIDIEPFLNAVANKYRNGILAIDEAGLYRLTEKSGEVIQPLKLLLKQRRKYNVEIYLIYHSVSEIPIRLFKWCNNMILFHQTDKFQHKAGVVPRIDELNAAKMRIEKKYFEGNLYYAERIQIA